MRPLPCLFLFGVAGLIGSGDGMWRSTHDKDKRAARRGGIRRGVGVVCVGLIRLGGHGGDRWQPDQSVRAVDTFR